MEGKKELHPDTENLLNICFDEIKLKLIRNQIKYGYTNEWLTHDWEDQCKEEMMEHLRKGDPRDVLVYCMFMMFRGWNTKECSHDEEIRTIKIDAIDRINQLIDENYALKTTIRRLERKNQNLLTGRKDKL